MRYEIKYIFNNDQLSIFMKWMFSQSNFNKKHPNRLVNSIYFDDAFNTSANDNLAGISQREKYRLRWYNVEVNKLSNFEIKRKVNKLNSKIYLKLENKYKNLSDLTNSEIAYIFQKTIFEYDPQYNFDFFPKLQVQYFRSYYYLNNDKDNRLTYDTNVLFSRASDIKISPIRYKCKYDIIEHKFTNENQKNNLRLSINNIQNQSFSKYIYGMDAIYSLD